MLESTKHTKKPQPTHTASWGFNRAPGGIRTPNLLIRSQMLIAFYLGLLQYHSGPVRLTGTRPH
ncbi:hypothetical protein KPHES18084_01720 [Corynebacterium ulcerans]